MQPRKKIMLYPPNRLTECRFGRLKELVSPFLTSVSNADKFVRSAFKYRFNRPALQDHQWGHQWNKQ